MTTKPTLLLAGLFSIFAFACAGDPNKQANDARAAKIEAERKQSQDSAEGRSDARVNAAEVKRENTEATAGGSTASKDRASADAKLAEARDVHRAKATARLEKLDARTSELKALIDRAGAKASTAARDALKTVATQRSMVTRSLDDLPKVANDGWKQATTRLDAQLDDLERLEKAAANEIDRFR